MQAPGGALEQDRFFAHGTTALQLFFYTCSSTLVFRLSRAPSARVFSAVIPLVSRSASFPGRLCAPELRARINEVFPRPQPRHPRAGASVVLSPRFRRAPPMGSLTSARQEPPPALPPLRSGSTHRARIICISRSATFCPDASCAHVVPAGSGAEGAGWRATECGSPLSSPAARRRVACACARASNELKASTR
jgi:hypothetical protein